MRYITFKDMLIQKILDGTKTQTRRIMNPMPEYRNGVYYLPGDTTGYGAELLAMHAPLGRKGEIFGIKENAWMWCERRPDGLTATGRRKWRYAPMRAAPVHYRADYPEKPQTDIVSPDTGNIWEWRLKISRFLPAWAVRIHCEIVDVRVQRVQEISEQDALSEGITYNDLPSNSLDPMKARTWFRGIWNTIHLNAYTWDQNPVVFAYTFKMVTP